MLYKLWIHRNKSHWINDDFDVFAAYDRFIDENKELRDAFSKWNMNPTMENWQEVEYEIADNANFLMMMVDIQRSGPYSALRDNP